LRKNGSGIGLSIVKNIVDHYGGNILVKDNRNKHGEINGSISKLQLPKANISQNDKFYSS
jgi:signal transduction histidine kinase